MNYINSEGLCGNLGLAKMVVGIIFSNGGSTVMKFHFANTKLREQLSSTKNLIGKYQILKPSGERPPATPFRVPTPMVAKCFLCDIPVLHG